MKKKKKVTWTRLYVDCGTETITIWTRAYFPFILGGNVHQPISCRVEATGPLDLGRGFMGYIVDAPDGSTVVAEATSGAVVGDTIEAVRKDIKSASVITMRKQVKEAVAVGKTARSIGPDLFWNKMGKVAR